MSDTQLEPAADSRAGAPAAGLGLAALIAIVVGSMRQADARTKILQDPRWKGIEAVREGKVWKAPVLPFNWFDRPPSPARLLGLRWLGGLLYPVEMPVDIARETKAFYTLFYERKLSDAEVREILSQD